MQKDKRSNSRKSRAFFLLALIFCGYGWLVFATLKPSLPTLDTPLKLYSNQLRDDLKRVVMAAITSASESISLQIYGLTDPDVITLLQKKESEGVHVQIFHDKSATKGLPFFRNAYPIQVGGLMHRKILVIDHCLSLVGTANFTPHSLKMHDNVVVGIWSNELASFFESGVDESHVKEIGKTMLSSYLLPDFSKKALDRVCSCIERAENTIDVAMFTLTHPRLVKALCKAAKRGLQVRIALDRYTALGASKRAADQLQNAGATLLTGRGNQLLHHKWALIDSHTLVLGSANWTRAAFKSNQDCLLLLENLPPNAEKQLQRLTQVIANSSEKR